MKRSGIVGHRTNDIVYARLAPAVLEELRRRIPRDEKGRPKYKLFQLLTTDVGHPKLVVHFKEVLAIWIGFYSILNRSLPRFNETLELPFDNPRAMEALPMKQISFAPVKRRKI